MKDFFFETSCVSANGSDISEMVDLARLVTWKTLLKHVSIDEIISVLPVHKYIPLNKDGLVRFYHSRYQGKECYFIDHSAIEYVFVRNNG